jgi:hypothetical protein
MSYFVTVTFDIHDGSAADYTTTYAEMAKIGLRPTIITNSGTRVDLPASTVAGEFNYPSAKTVRDDISQRAQDIFARNRLSGNVFVAVGGDWAWGQRTP